MSVSVIFKSFSDELRISTARRSIIAGRYEAICRRLNKDFWDVDVTSGGRYVGSYGRNTATSWVSDIDMLFELPWTLYTKYNSYSSNGQSALLQAVKNSIARTYPTTYLRGDGQIIQVQFANDMQIEVLPVFKYTDGSFAFADSNNNGSWKTTNPVPEIEVINGGNNLTNKNLKRLCRMARAWKRFCIVPIKGLLIDTLAFRFLMNWEYKHQSYLYYDWMSRDFFKYLKEQSSGQSTWYAVGSNQAIYNSENFRYKATIAYNKSLEAITLGSDERWWATKQKWREIYGYRFPS